MNRDRQEIDQLVRKFEEILPFLKNQKNFGWYFPECDGDPLFKIYPDTWDFNNVPFKVLTVNVKTGWHSDVVYRDVDGTVKHIPEGVTEIKDEWSDRCYKSNCKIHGRTVNYTQS